MHVRVRIFGKPDTVVVVESKLTKIEQFRRIIKEKFSVDIKLQRLFYGGKLLEDGYTFHDYNIKLNDVIQLMVKIQADNDAAEKKDKENCEEKCKSNENKVLYQDATSVLYSVGDLVDMRDREQGAWFEGKIVRIVKDPEFQSAEIITDGNEASEINGNESSELNDKENDFKNVTLNATPESPSKTKKTGIVKYFSGTPKKKQESKPNSDDNKSEKNSDIGLLYKVQLDAEEEDSENYCKLSEIRPRARTVINVEDLKPGDKVMVNHNTDYPLEKGYWYDVTVNEIKKLRTSYEIIGTLYLGPEAIPQNDTKIRIHDKIFAIETVIPLDQRTEEYEKLMVSDTEPRTQPLNCLTCRDDEDVRCKDCGCYLCSGKECPEKIVLCDECNKGFHMKCLEPPLTELPDEDWYCPTCKRDTTEVIAPGAAKQTKKTTASKTSRDWGRGMACVGKTKTCAMPPNHFGPIPGIEVGMCWRFRIQLSETGVHRPPVSGIHGRDVEGAYSIVLSGGYEDDYDNGYEFTYTGSGGRDLSGNKRTAEQSCDQTLTRENKALARNCAVKEVSESGGDAGENWRNGKPVRVVRSYKMQKHFPKYAPKEGIRYDGIYKVVKYYPEKGLSGYRVWKYLLRRDDPSPAPWEDDAKQYPIIYPDGYLEAEAEKKALKMKNGKATSGSKKRALRESNNMSDSDEDISQPLKKRKTESKKGEKAKKKDTESTKAAQSPKVTIPSMFSTKSESSKGQKESALSESELTAVKADTLNARLWDECLIVCEARGKKEFVEHVTQLFLCIICQEVVASPVTTSCLHNFCMACLKLAFKSTGSRACPCCRQSLTHFEMSPNDHLKTALQAIMPGYDAGKK